MILDKDIMIALIGILGTLLGTVLGFGLTIFYDSRKEKSQAKSELQKAINEVIHISIVNNYPLAMNNLRKVMISNVHIIKNEELAIFYDKWLTNPIIQAGHPVSNLYSDTEIDIFVQQLLNIKL